MAKWKIAKIIALITCVIMVLLSLPMMSSAASNGFTFNAAKDILPGGDGVGFYDNPSAGGTVRGLEGSSSVCVRKSEWVKYDLSSLPRGDYLVSVSTGNTLEVELTLSMNNVTLNKFRVLPTGGYSVYKATGLCKVTVSGGESILTIKNSGTAAMYLGTIILEDYSEIQKKQDFLSQKRPFKSYHVPCLVEAENFNYGEEGYAYEDNDELNLGGEYREDTNVDIYKANDLIYINMQSGEWLKYTVNVQNAGNFDLVAKWRDNLETSIARVYIDDYEVLRNVSGTSISIGDIKENTIGTVYLPTGSHTIVIKCMEGDIDFDYFRFKKSTQTGIDVSNKDNFRPWSESQVLSEEDKAAEKERVVNDVEREIYVDSNAKAGGNGSKENPFNNIEDAKAFVRTVNKNMKGDLVVNLKGEFKVDKTLEFTKEDSGSGIYNVIYRGEDGTVVHGGRKVDGWKKVEGTPLYQTELKDVEDFRQLYIGENRGTRAKSEWLYNAVAEYDDTTTEGEIADGYYLNVSDFDGDFSKPQYMEMVWLPSWRVVRAPIMGIEKQEDGTLLAKFRESYVRQGYNNSAPVKTSHPYYLENAPEFLDVPGEFYFDRDTKVLTYYPLESEDMNSVECYIPQTQLLLSISGESATEKVRNITFEGIEFKYAAWERPTKSGYSTVQADELFTDPDERAELGGSEVMITPANIEIDYGENINFIKNEFKHLGATALSIDNATSNSFIEGNLFDDISAAALTLGNPLTPATAGIKEYTRRIKVSNNLLRRNAVEYMVPVITGYYVNSIRIDHNDMLDCPYSGISMGWGWDYSHTLSAYNKITNNKIENVLYKLMDGGHIYTLSIMRGGEISGNYMIKSAEWKGGIYLDNSSRYITSFNNVFEDCEKWFKLTYHTIRDNVAYNNYSESSYAVDYPDINNIEKAKGKVNGEWPEEAKEIIKNAGLTDEYKYLLSDYEKIEGLRNDNLPRHNYYTYDAYCYGGNYIEGGEGVAYHEVLHRTNDRGQGERDEPSVFESYNGTGTLRIDVTGQGEWVKNKITVPESGEYDVYVSLSVVQEGTAVTVEVDDEVLANKQVVEPNCTGYNKWDPYYVGKIYLEKGDHIFKVEHAVHNFSYAYVGIKKSGIEFKRGDGFKPDLMKAFK